MNELQNKVETSIERLRAFEPTEGYYLAFSGGKDSVVLKALADMAGVKYEAVYRVTSVDPPELYAFVRDVHPDVKREVPRDSNGDPITMWNLIPRKMMPPTRRARYCCEYLKEDGGDGKKTLTGVRWEESARRKESQGIATILNGQSERQLAESDDFRKNSRGSVILVNDNEDSRRMVESCYKRRKTVINPIIDWTEKEIWAFIRQQKIPYCSLYDEGFHRLGCIGCPLARRRARERELSRWSAYKRNYLRAFERMLTERVRRGKPRWTTIPDATAQDIYNWWMQYDILPGQIDLFAEEDEEEADLWNT